MRATEESPAANGVSLGADQARRMPVATVAAAGVSHTDTLRMEHPAVHTAADTLVDTPVVDAAAVAVTVAAADAKYSV
jgi:hypothetical protein